MEPPVHSAVSVTILTVSVTILSVSVSTLTVSVKNSQLVLLYFLLVSIVNKDT